jgi:hypothetical protein
MGEQRQHKRAVIAGQHLRIVIALATSQLSLSSWLAKVRVLG